MLKAGMAEHPFGRDVSERTGHTAVTTRAPLPLHTHTHTHSSDFATSFSYEFKI